MGTCHSIAAANKPAVTICEPSKVVEKFTAVAPPLSPKDKQDSSNPPINAQSKNVSSGSGNSNNFIKSKFAKLRRSSRFLRQKTNQTKKQEKSPPNETSAKINFQPISDHQLPLVKVKLVDFLEFQEFNTFVEAIHLKVSNETYFLKSNEPVQVLKTAQSRMSSNIFNEISTNVVANKKTNSLPTTTSTTAIPQTNRFGFKPPTTLAIAKQATSSSFPPTPSLTEMKPAHPAASQPHPHAKSVFKSGDIEIASTSSASPSCSISSNNNSWASRRHYLSPHKTFLKQPTSFVNPPSAGNPSHQPSPTPQAPRQLPIKSNFLKASSNSGTSFSIASHMAPQPYMRHPHQQSQSSSLSSLSSSNSSTNLSCSHKSNPFRETRIQIVKSASSTNTTQLVKSSSSSSSSQNSSNSTTVGNPIQINLENSNITKPVKKDKLDTLSTATAASNEAITTNKKDNNNNTFVHRKHSFTPYSLNLSEKQLSDTNDNSKSNPTKMTESSRVAVVPQSKLMRFSARPPVSSKLTTNLKAFSIAPNSSQLVSLSIRREDSAYCSSTSSTVSSVACQDGANKRESTASSSISSSSSSSNVAEAMMNSPTGSNSDTNGNSSNSVNVVLVSSSVEVVNTEQPLNGCDKSDMPSLVVTAESTVEMDSSPNLQQVSLKFLSIAKTKKGSK